MVSSTNFCLIDVCSGPNQTLEFLGKKWEFMGFVDKKNRVCGQGFATEKDSNSENPDHVEGFFWEGQIFYCILQ